MEESVHGKAQSVRVAAESTAPPTAQVKKNSRREGFIIVSMSDLVGFGGKMLAFACNVKCSY
jgi:hypothetical protein